VTSGGGGNSGQRRPHSRDEIVEFGSPRRGGKGRLSRLLLAALVVAALVFVLYHPSKHRVPPAPVSVTSVGHRILGISANWDLFGLSSNGLVSVEFARGQITRTVLPPALGDGPVSFIVGPHQVIIRPLDNVPGYAVPDGQPSQPLTGMLARGGQLLPGPVADEEWYIGGSQHITLVGPQGAAAGLVVTTLSPQYPAQSATSDGRGYVVLFDSSGHQFDATPASLRPVGALLVAVGPTDWLALDCQHGQCTNAVIDAATGARRTLSGASLNIVTWPWPADPGVAAPNGSFAAVTVARGAQGAALDLVNLSTGRTTTLPVPIGTSSDSRTLTWSPDSRWLFALAGNGKLVAIRASDGSVHSLGVRLPALTEIAMRGVGG
jgi:hypothetical protein